MDIRFQPPGREGYNIEVGVDFLYFIRRVRNELKLLNFDNVSFFSIEDPTVNQGFLDAFDVILEKAKKEQREDVYLYGHMVFLFKYHMGVPNTHVIVLFFSNGSCEIHLRYEDKKYIDEILKEVCNNIEYLSVDIVENEEEGKEEEGDNLRFNDDPVFINCIISKDKDGKHHLVLGTAEWDNVSFMIFHLLGLNNKSMMFSKGLSN